MDKNSDAPCGLYVNRDLRACFKRAKVVVNDARTKTCAKTTNAFSHGEATMVAVEFQRPASYWILRVKDQGSCRKATFTVNVFTFFETAPAFRGPTARPAADYTNEVDILLYFIHFRTIFR